MGHQKKKKGKPPVTTDRTSAVNGTDTDLSPDAAESGISLLRTAEREVYLLEELEALRLENQRLTQTISSLRKELGEDAEEDMPLRRPKPRTRQEAWRRQFRDEGRAAKSFSKKTFPRYLIGIVNASTPGRLVKKVTRFFRRVRLVRTIVAIGTAIMTAVVLLPVYVIVLPIMLTLSGLMAFLSLFFAFRMNRQLRHNLDGRHLYVLVATEDICLHPDSFFARNARQLAHTPGCAVLVVSPHNLRTQGLGGKGLFLTARRECDALYVVRKHYFFNLRRKVLRRIDPNMTVIY